MVEEECSVRKLAVLLCSGSFTIQSSLLQVFCEETEKECSVKELVVLLWSGSIAIQI